MYHYFDLSWLVPTNLIEFVWLVCFGFLQSSAISQITLSSVRLLSFISWGWLLQSVYSLKDNVSSSLCSRSYFKFLLLVFPEFLESSRYHWKCVACSWFQDSWQLCRSKLITNIEAALSVPILASFKT